MRRIQYLLLLLAALLCLAACGETSGAPVNTPTLAGRLAQSAAERAPYDAPDFADAVFHAGKAEGGEGVLLDLSATDEGYVAVSAISDQRLKFQVVYGDVKYNYDLAGDGTPSFFPLQSGDGLYLFRVMKNVSEEKYAELYAATCEVALRDEFQPFLRPSDYVSYDQSAACVKKAEELSRSAGDSVGMVAEVYEFICDSVVYDKEKAASVTLGYLPDPDETMRSGKGICFDYAALAAAMLRSQGIPTKVVFGYVAPDDLYHAWNMFYTEETGWVTVSFQTDAKRWNRLDLTFSANGADSSFIGEGSNYTELLFY